MADVEAIVAAAVSQVEPLIARPDAPRVGCILGSGLGGLGAALEDVRTLPTTSVGGYPPSTVPGHAGEFLCGRIGDTTVIAVRGRIHAYEGHPLAVTALPARVLCSLGVAALVITNAAGAANDGFAPGDVMLIRDHINLQGGSPLEGANVDAWGPRFPDMSRTYPEALRARARAAAEAVGLTLQEGIYCAVRGPQYETPAEVRLIRQLGADAIGMSTVPEAIVASHMGVPVLGVSLISNLGAGLGDAALSHDEVMEAGKKAAHSMTEWAVRLIPELVPAS